MEKKKNEERKGKIERMCVGAVWIYIFIVFGVGVIMTGVAISDLVNTGGEIDEGNFEEFLEECDKVHPELHQEMLEQYS